MYSNSWPNLHSLQSGDIKKLAEISTNLKFAERNNLVRETQFPTICPRPTVWTTLVRHATYKAQASQCNLSPCKYCKQTFHLCKKNHFNNLMFQIEDKFKVK